MTPSELSRLLDSSAPPVLLHVLPGEVFEACRIPGSVNACVYETAFPEQVSAMKTGPESPIVVYGAGEGSLDARVAVQRLRSAGYQNVAMLDDGLAGWKSAGFPTEGSGNLPAAPSLDGVYQADIGASVIRWTGRNPTNQHFGTVRLSGGRIVIREGVLESARFTIDMNSIACDDLEDATWRGMLVSHLKTDDFFDTAAHPTAEFVATHAEPTGGDAEGRPNFRLRGDFTLRGITQPLEFPVGIGTANGSRITGQGVLQIDRTDFGSLYGSGRFFRFLGKHAVNDPVHLDVMIHADKAG